MNVKIRTSCRKFIKLAGMTATSAGFIGCAELAEIGGIPPFPYDDFIPGEYGKYRRYLPIVIQAINYASEQQLAYARSEAAKAPPQVKRNNRVVGVNTARRNEPQKIVLVNAQTNQPVSKKTYTPKSPVRSGETVKIEGYNVAML